MSDSVGTIRGAAFLYGNCSDCCPCQFEGLPTYRRCTDTIAIQINESRHGTTTLDELEIAVMFARPEPIRMAEHGVRIDSTNDFAFRRAEIGRDWSKTKMPMRITPADSHGQFCEPNLCQAGAVT